MRKKILKFTITLLFPCLMLPVAAWAGNGTALQVNLTERVCSNLAPQLVVKSSSFKINFSAQAENENLLPVYDHYQKRIGLRPRSSVHKEGDLHRGVQAYIIRETADGVIQVLRQKRSNKVDIAKGKYDQSVATQELLEDNGDPEKTLKRGLFQELGIREDEVEIARVGAQGWLRVHKKYAEDAALYNRENVSLFLVKLKTDRQIRADNFKIDEIEWVNWSDYIKDVLANRKLYTKTGSFYVLDPLMRNETEKSLRAFMRGEKMPALPVRRVCFYSYDDRYDITSYIDWDNNPVINIFDNQTGQMQTLKDVISFNYIEGKIVEHIKIIFITKDLNVSIWENGQVTSLEKQGDRKSLRYIEGIMSAVNTVIREIETTDLSNSERGIMEDTKTRFTHTLNLLRAKILAGEVKFSDESMDFERGKGVLLEGNVEILSLVGTFDPPHFAHIDRLLHAAAYGVETQFDSPKTIIPFISPVGENAPSPEGTEGWKTQKTPALLRHEMSKIMTDIFSPFIRTSTQSLEYPDSYGTENALRLAEGARNMHLPWSGTITFTLVCGSDTFKRWQNNFDDLLMEFQNKNPEIRLRMIVFNEPSEKFDVAALSRSKVPVTFFSDLMPLNDYATGYHSSLFRQERNFNLLPLALQSYIKTHQLYNKEGAEVKIFNAMNIEQMVEASI